ncbi:MAG: 4-hydroxybenzoate octaprenyltransferase [Pseudomonadota bacterium]
MGELSNEAGDRVADAVKGSWVETRLPRPARPYAQLARFDRPIGWWLLLLPCWWSTALAAIAADAPWPNPWHLILFLIGAVVMRGAGCTYNDIVDRDIDDQVARTRSRPIPSGRVSARSAAIFMVALSLTGLMVLLQFNAFSIGLGIASLGIVAIYPFMKRITYWPQSVLGLAFSWGALMGWSATFASLDPPALILYAGSILWVIGYDTIYAHQDKEDDAIVGVKSTARLFGDQTRTWLIVFYGGATTLFTLAFFLAGAGWISFVGLLVGVGHMAYQLINLDIDDADQCLALFRSNRNYGLILFAGLSLDAITSSL